jgi:peptidyl-prolyl cis-trans isomerase D
MLAFQSQMIHLHSKIGDLVILVQIMVKPFNDLLFNNGIGKVGLVETDFGYHIIRLQTNKGDR